MLRALWHRLVALLPFKRRPRPVLLSERTFSPCEDELRSALDERYLAMRAAMASGSADAIASLLTPDFASVDVNGASTSATQMIDGVLALKIDRSKRDAVTTIVRIERNGDEAIVQQHYSMKSHDDAPPTMPKYVQALSVDTWREVSGTWLLRRTQTLETESMSSSGKLTFRARIEHGSVEISSP